MADELISRQAAIKLLRGECVAKYPCSFYVGLSAAADELSKLAAADAEEVVRCKDCLHWSSGENEAEKWEYCKFLNFDMGPYAFCIFGERREENAD